MKSPLFIPLLQSRIAAGFPSPADDYLDVALDLNEHLIAHPAATFYVRVAGSSMEGAGIFDDDLLIVDRSLEATLGNIVVAVIDGDFTVKRLVKRRNKVLLVSEHPDYPPIQVHEESEATIWGVVTYCLHRC